MVKTKELLISRLGALPDDTGRKVKTIEGTVLFSVSGEKRIVNALDQVSCSWHFNTSLSARKPQKG